MSYRCKDDKRRIFKIIKQKEGRAYEGNIKQERV